MDGPRNSHATAKSNERERQIPEDISYAWTLKLGHRTNSAMKQTQGGTDWRLPKVGEAGGGGKDWEFEISRRN